MHRALSDYNNRCEVHRRDQVEYTFWRRAKTLKQQQLARDPFHEEVRRLLDEKTKLVDSMCNATSLQEIRRLWLDIVARLELEPSDLQIDGHNTDGEAA